MGPEFSILLERYHAVYVGIPKVACTSMKVALAPLLGVDLKDLNRDPHAVRFPQPPHVERNGVRLYPGLYKFAFVRNPWDRLVSCFRDKIAGEVNGFIKFSVRPGVANSLARFEAFFANMTFEEFVMAVDSIPDVEADAHFRSQSTFVLTNQGEVGVNFLGRFENLQQDFNLISERIGLPSSIELPRLQTAPCSTNYVNYYTAKTRRLAANRFRNDIKAFEYQFGS